MKDILNQPKFKGDVHEDKPFSAYKARSEPSTGFAGIFGGSGSEVAKPMFQKSAHPHGAVKNKFRVRP